MLNKTAYAIVLMMYALVSVAFAQDNVGEIEGKVVELDANNSLADANIVVEGTDLKAVTGTDGTFEISGVPAGKYTVRATKAGYQSLTIEDVEVKSGQTTRLDISLAIESIQLGAVEVKGRKSRATVAGILSKQRQAATIGSAISLEQISRSPDSDASDVLKRVTGISVVGDRFVFVRGLSERYSNARLNNSALSSPEPDKWVVPFDIFPAAILSNAVVTKTFSPDMPGDFAGGSIDLTTKEFTDSFTGKFSASFGYDSDTTFQDIMAYEGGDLDLLGFDDGTRALPDAIAENAANKTVVGGGRFGGGFSDQELEEFGEAFPNIWNASDKTALFNQSYSASLGNQIDFMDKPLGLVGAIIYKNGYSFKNEDQYYYIRGAKGELEARHHYEDLETSKNDITLGAIFNASWQLSEGNKMALRTTFNHNATDEVLTYNIFPNRDHNLDEKSTTLRWVQRSLLSVQFSGERQMPFLSSQLDWRASYSLATRNEPDTRELLYEADINRADRDAFRLADESNSGTRFFSDLLDNNFDLGLDLSIPFTQWNLLPANFKIGGSFTIKDREIDSRRFRFKHSDFFDVNLYQDAESLFVEENISPIRFELEEDTRATDNYGAEQIIDAGYAMIDTPIIEKLRLVTGVRVEFSEQEVRTFELFNPDSEPVVGKISETDILPAINLTYNFTDDMSVRLGASQTVSRPSFRELSMFEFTDIGGHAIIGNPDLKRALIQNYDLRWEFYTGISEFVSLALFYKHFTDPIEKSVKITSAELTSSWQNAKSAYSYRAEMEIRKTFGFIMPQLSEFSITGNLALIKSKVELYPNGSETSKERPLQGQSPYVVNVTVGYVFPRINTDVSFLYNVFGERIIEVGVSGTPDIYEEPFHKLDLVISQPLGGDLSAKFTARNLLDPEAKFTQGDEIQRIYMDGRSYSLGFSYSW